MCGMFLEGEILVPCCGFWKIDGEIEQIQCYVVWMRIITLFICAERMMEIEDIFWSCGETQFSCRRCLRELE